MKKLLLTVLTLILLGGCTEYEDAADVNQERIQADYCTIFNGTRETTKAMMFFKFGYTPLKMSRAMYYEKERLFEQEDFLNGLHYSRELNGIVEDGYQWTDEEGTMYANKVKAYSFKLREEITELQKHRYYKLPWKGKEIPYEAGSFRITIESQVDHSIHSFHAGELLEIESTDLDEVPTGKALMTISRDYHEPVDQSTAAGGSSGVSYVLEFNIRIVK
jgi:hypothetical protein